MQLPPWSVIISWPKPDYDDPETRGNALLVLMILFSVLVFLAVIGRYYSRIVIKRWFGWDDSMITLAWVRFSMLFRRELRLTMLKIFTIGMNAVVILVSACRLHGKRICCSHQTGQSKIRMGSPRLGSRVQYVPKGEHHRIRCEAALRGRLHLHPTVAGLLLLSVGGRERHCLVLLDPSCQYGVQYLPWHLIYLLGNLALRVSLAIITISGQLC